MDWLSLARALLLVGVASSVPWALGRWLGPRFAAPLDFGITLRDGKRLLGSHKTWRGFVSGVLACALVAPLTGIDAAVGAGVGATALLGDALSSFVKRRLALPPGAEVLGLDQLPEAVLPLLLFAGPLGLGAAEIVAVGVAFTLLDAVATPLRHRA
ncbi:MAG TPA: CDP-archaeol synthase [Gammaproteobacteria bacterium]